MNRKEKKKYSKPIIILENIILEDCIANASKAQLDFLSPAATMEEWTDFNHNPSQGTNPWVSEKEI
ncbi:hypothetical protein [Sphingobacterium bovistauri]|uniref:Uncharacterized protein n=1 Tax=Sphingobacterium bovistauri TaxID=2781959 RepID=A0ABS7Z9J9_9SPHI|nr:hypothetical protein [Sphingobacterium bovistauri]MCA5006830.1 hypothetical protein [Sphingobacterium bovistauri]